MHTTYLLTLGGAVAQIFDQGNVKDGFSVSFAAGAQSLESMSIDGVLDMADERIPGAILREGEDTKIDFTVLDPERSQYPEWVFSGPQLPCRSEDGHKNRMRFVKLFFAR
jgi:hypothetical protein